MLLKCAQRWDVVDPTDMDNGDNSSDGVSIEDRKWEARALIQSAVTFDIYDHNDPRECWIYLQNRFASNSPARRWKFESRLYSLKTEEGEKVDSFFSRVTHTLSHLRDMGVVIDEKELVSRLILALPESWDTFSTIVWQETDKLMKNELFSRMRLVESRNESRTSHWA